MALPGFKIPALRSNSFFAARYTDDMVSRSIETTGVPSVAFGMGGGISPYLGGHEKPFSQYDSVTPQSSLVLRYPHGMNYNDNEPTAVG